MLQDMKNNIVCPECGNPLNSLECVGIKKGTATLFAQCWSGDLNNEKPRHYFIVKLAGLSVLTKNLYGRGYKEAEARTTPPKKG